METGPIGRKRWAIADGYIPASSTGAGRAFESHETACLLNAGETDARVEITLYFADREPVGPYRLTVPARRTLHLRFNDLTDPAPVPRDTDYASIIVADQPIVVQHTRAGRAGAALDGGFPGRLTRRGTTRDPTIGTGCSMARLRRADYARW